MTYLSYFKQAMLSLPDGTSFSCTLKTSWEASTKNVKIIGATKKNTPLQPRNFFWGRGFGIWTLNLMDHDGSAFVITMVIAIHYFSVFLFSTGLMGNFLVTSGDFLKTYDSMTSKNLGWWTFITTSTYQLFWCDPLVIKHGWVCPILNSSPIEILFSLLPKGYQYSDYIPSVFHFGWRF